MTEEVEAYNRLLISNERILATLKKRFKGNTAEDVKKLLARDIEEMEAKIKRIKAKIDG